MEVDRSLFGTDGVRGRAGVRLTPELATALGRAAIAAQEAERPRVLIVRDTRESGPMLEAALAAGVMAAGGEVWLGGVLPSPAAAVLVRRYGFDLAAVVSASHNPFHDNGIKFFSAAGMKLDDHAEARIEQLMKAEGGAAAEDPDPPAIGGVRKLHGALADYLRALESHFRLDLSGLRVMLDCANGAAYEAAPQIFERLGAEVIPLAVEPDGRNINDGCGSTHIEHLAERMANGEADIGFAFDGDADRVLAVDGSGRARDGDELIALAAAHLKGRGELPGGVVVTVMSNYGFHLAMREAEIDVATAAVGDRYVLKQMIEGGQALGGEQSGHVINTDFVPTGDGIASALLLIQALEGRNLAEVEPFEKLPQRLVNVAVRDRGALKGAEAVWRAVEAEEAGLDGSGRVLIRPSGTEELIRVMVEAPGPDQADSICERLADIVRRELGA